MWSHINDVLGSTYVCTADDVKPAEGVSNGAVLFEMDTAIFYMYDEENKTWHPMP